MAFGNPFKDDPDFQYLAVDRKKLLEEQTQPFDAKTSCWIPDHKEGYIKATITATKGEEVSVTTENNEVGLPRNHCSLFRTQPLSCLTVDRVTTSIRQNVFHL